MLSAEKFLSLQQLSFGLSGLYSRRKNKQHNGEGTEGYEMKQDTYNRLVNYIIENQDRFYRLAYSYVKNQEDALDAVQNAVLKALRHYETLRDENAVKTWFYRILVNESIELIRRRKEELFPEDSMVQELPYYEKGYELHDDLYEQISRLEEEVQTVIRLRFFEEMTLQEIADVMKMNLNTVKAKLYRGLKLLKQNIEEEAVWSS